jgi:hypothetical protein
MTLTPNLKAEINEEETGWDITIRGYGHSNNYTGFKTVGEAVEFLLSEYPGRHVELYIASLEAYNQLLRDLERVD